MQKAARENIINILGWRRNFLRNIIPYNNTTVLMPVEKVSPQTASEAKVVYFSRNGNEAICICRVPDEHNIDKRRLSGIRDLSLSGGKKIFVGRFHHSTAGIFEMCQSNFRRSCANKRWKDTARRKKVPTEDEVNVYQLVKMAFNAESNVAGPLGKVGYKSNFPHTLLPLAFFSQHNIDTNSH